MPSFLTKVFGRKRDGGGDDSPRSRTSNGELLDGKFEDVSPNVSPSATEFPDLNTNGSPRGRGAERADSRLRTFFRSKSRPTSPSRQHRKLDELPHLPLSLFADIHHDDSQILLTDKVIGERKLTPVEAVGLVKACSQAINNQGLDTLGIMNPHWYSASPEAQRRLISLFIHSLTSKSPLSSHASFDSEINATRSTHDIAAVLRWGLRHLQLQGNSFGHKEDWYETFFDQERKAEFPPKAFSETLAPLIPSEHLELLQEVLDIFSNLAAHAETNSTSGSNLSKMFGLWLLNGHRVETKDDWKSFYNRWEVAGRQLEHVFFARIRDEAVEKRTPKRLLDLVRKYPFYDDRASPSTDRRLLPRPRFTTLVHDALLVRVETELPNDRLRPKSKIHPLRLIAEALSSPTNDDSEFTSLWTKIVDASKAEGTGTPLSRIFSDDTIRFLSLLPAEQGVDTSKSPTFSLLPQSPASPQRAKRLSFSLSEFTDEIKRVHSTQSRMTSTTAAAASPLSPISAGDWSVFSASGFGSSPTLTPLSSALFSSSDLERTVPPSAVASPLRPSRHGKEVSYTSSVSTRRKSVEFSSPAAQSIKSAEEEEYSQEMDEILKANVSKIGVLQVVQLDEAFIDFWSDTLLDPVSAEWPTFVVCKLKNALVPELTYPLPKEGDGPAQAQVEGEEKKEKKEKERTLKWLVLEQSFTVKPKPPPPAVSSSSTSHGEGNGTTTTTDRPHSPALSASGKKRFSFWTSAASRSNSVSSFGSRKKDKDRSGTQRVGEMGEVLEEDGSGSGTPTPRGVAATTSSRWRKRDKGSDVVRVRIPSPKGRKSVDTAKGVKSIDAAVAEKDGDASAAAKTAAAAAAATTAGGVAVVGAAAVVASANKEEEAPTAVPEEAAKGTVVEDTNPIVEENTAKAVDEDLSVVPEVTNKSIPATDETPVPTIIEESAVAAEGPVDESDTEKVRSLEQDLKDASTTPVFKAPAAAAALEEDKASEEDGVIVEKEVLEESVPISTATATIDKDTVVPPAVAEPSKEEEHEETEQVEGKAFPVVVEEDSDDNDVVLVEKSALEEAEAAEEVVEEALEVNVDVMEEDLVVVEAAAESEKGDVVDEATPTPVSEEDLEEPSQPAVEETSTPAPETKAEIVKEHVVEEAISVAKEEDVIEEAIAAPEQTTEEEEKVVEEAVPAPVEEEVIVLEKSLPAIFSEQGTHEDVAVAAEEEDESEENTPVVEESVAEAEAEPPVVLEEDLIAEAAVPVVEESVVVEDSTPAEESAPAVEETAVIEEVPAPPVVLEESIAEVAEPSPAVAVEESAGEEEVVPPAVEEEKVVPTAEESAPVIEEEDAVFEVEEEEEELAVAAAAVETPAVEDVAPVAEEVTLPEDRDHVDQGPILEDEEAVVPAPAANQPAPIDFVESLAEETPIEEAVEAIEEGEVEVPVAPSEELDASDNVESSEASADPVVGTLAAATENTFGSAEEETTAETERVDAPEPEIPSDVTAPVEVLSVTPVLDQSAPNLSITTEEEKSEATDALVESHNVAEPEIPNRDIEEAQETLADPVELVAEREAEEPQGDLEPTMEDCVVVIEIDAEEKPSDPDTEAADAERANADIAITTSEPPLVETELTSPVDETSLVEEASHESNGVAEVEHGPRPEDEVVATVKETEADPETTEDPAILQAELAPVAEIPAAPAQGTDDSDPIQEHGDVVTEPEAAVDSLLVEQGPAEEINATVAIEEHVDAIHAVEVESVAPLPDDTIATDKTPVDSRSPVEDVEAELAVAEEPIAEPVVEYGIAHDIVPEVAEGDVVVEAARVEEIAEEVPPAAAPPVPVEVEELQETATVEQAPEIDTPEENIVETQAIATDLGEPQSVETEQAAPEAFVPETAESKLNVDTPALEETEAQSIVDDAVEISTIPELANPPVELTIEDATAEVTTTTDGEHVEEEAARVTPEAEIVESSATAEHADGTVPQEILPITAHEDEPTIEAESSPAEETAAEASTVEAGERGGPGIEEDVVEEPLPEAKETAVEEEVIAEESVAPETEESAVAPEVQVQDLEAASPEPIAVEQEQEDQDPTVTVEEEDSTPISNQEVLEAALVLEEEQMDKVEEGPPEPAVAVPVVVESAADIQGVSAPPAAAEASDPAVEETLVEAEIAAPIDEEKDSIPAAEALEHIVAEESIVEGEPPAPTLEEEIQAPAVVSERKVEDEEATPGSESAKTETAIDESIVAEVTPSVLALDESSPEPEQSRVAGEEGTDDRNIEANVPGVVEEEVAAPASVSEDEPITAVEVPKEVEEDMHPAVVESKEVVAEAVEPVEENVTLEEDTKESIPIPEPEESVPVVEESTSEVEVAVPEVEEGIVAEDVQESSVVSEEPSPGAVQTLEESHTVDEQGDPPAIEDPGEAVSAGVTAAEPVVLEDVDDVQPPSAALEDSPSTSEDAVEAPADAQETEAAEAVVEEPEVAASEEIEGQEVQEEIEPKEIVTESVSQPVDGPLSLEGTTPVAPAVEGATPPVDAAVLEAAIEDSAPEPIATASAAVEDKAPIDPDTYEQTQEATSEDRDPAEIPQEDVVEENQLAVEIQDEGEQLNSVVAEEIEEGTPTQEGDTVVGTVAEAAEHAELEDDSVAATLDTTVEDPTTSSVVEHEDAKETDDLLAQVEDVATEVAEAEQDVLAAEPSASQPRDFEQEKDTPVQVKEHEEVQIDEEDAEEIENADVTEEEKLVSEVNQPAEISPKDQVEQTEVAEASVERENVESAAEVEIAEEVVSPEKASDVEELVVEEPVPQAHSVEVTAVLDTESGEVEKGALGEEEEPPAEVQEAEASVLEQEVIQREAAEEENAMGVKEAISEESTPAVADEIVEELNTQEGEIVDEVKESVEEGADIEATENGDDKHSKELVEGTVVSSDLVETVETSAAVEDALANEESAILVTEAEDLAENTAFDSDADPGAEPSSGAPLVVDDALTESITAPPADETVATTQEDQELPTSEGTPETTEPEIVENDSEPIASALDSQEAPTEDPNATSEPAAETKEDAEPQSEETVTIETEVPVQPMNEDGGIEQPLEAGEESTGTGESAQDAEPVTTVTRAEAAATEPEAEVPALADLSGEVEGGVSASSEGHQVEVEAAPVVVEAGAISEDNLAEEDAPVDALNEDSKGVVELEAEAILGGGGEDVGLSQEEQNEAILSGEPAAGIIPAIKEGKDEDAAQRDVSEEKEHAVEVEQLETVESEPAMKVEVEAAEVGAPIPEEERNEVAESSQAEAVEDPPALDIEEESAAEVDTESAPVVSLEPEKPLQVSGDTAENELEKEELADPMTVPAEAIESDPTSHVGGAKDAPVRLSREPVREEDDIEERDVKEESLVGENSDILNSTPAAEDDGQVVEVDAVVLDDALVEKDADPEPVLVEDVAVQEDFTAEAKENAIPTPEVASIGISAPTIEETSDVTPADDEDQILTPIDSQAITPLIVEQVPLPSEAADDTASSPLPVPVTSTDRSIEVESEAAEPVSLEQSFPSEPSIDSSPENPEAIGDAHTIGEEEPADDTSIVVDESAASVPVDVSVDASASADVLSEDVVEEVQVQEPVEGSLDKAPVSEEDELPAKKFQPEDTAVTQEIPTENGAGITAVSEEKVSVPVMPTNEGEVALSSAELLPVEGSIPVNDVAHQEESVPIEEISPEGDPAKLDADEDATRATGSVPSDSQLNSVDPEHAPAAIPIQEQVAEVDEAMKTDILEEAITPPEPAAQDFSMPQLDDVAPALESSTVPSTSDEVELVKSAVNTESEPQAESSTLDNVNVISGVPHIEPLKTGDNDSSNVAVDLLEVPLVNVAPNPLLVSTSELTSVPITEDAETDNAPQHPEQLLLAETLAEAHDLPSAIEQAFADGLTPSAEALLGAVQATLTATVFAPETPTAPAPEATAEPKEQKDKTDVAAVEAPAVDAGPTPSVTAVLNVNGNGHHHVDEAPTDTTAKEPITAPAEEKLAQAPIETKEPEAAVEDARNTNTAQDEDAPSSTEHTTAAV